jgi:hypothetical protein
MSVWNPALPANTSKISLSANYIRNNELAVQLTLSASSLVNNYPLFPFDGVTGIYFYGNAAPPGWTLVTTVGDALLAIKGGSSAYNVAGQQVVGTWNGPGYALLLTDLPSNKTYNVQGGTSANPIAFQSVNPQNAHSHNWTTTRPVGAVGILATKNA